MAICSESGICVDVGPVGARASALSHAGRFVTDAAGRVIVLHGVNMVYKTPPYYPSAIGFGSDDALFLARAGFNVVRVGGDLEGA